MILCWQIYEKHQSLTNCYVQLKNADPSLRDLGSRSVVGPELSDVVNAPSHESNLLFREECAGLHDFLLRLLPCRMLGGCKESGSGDYKGDFHVNESRTWVLGHESHVSSAIRTHCS